MIKIGNASLTHLISGMSEIKSIVTLFQKFFITRIGNSKRNYFQVCRSEEEVDKVLEGERDAGLCHQTLLRNIMFASQSGC